MKISIINKIKVILQRNYLCIFFLLSFLLWIYCFRGFVFDKLILISDAQAYFEHVRFFLANLKHGIYPMWEPMRDHGLPIELFLRRIGSFNPFFFIIYIFQIIGFSYTLSYLFFLGLYYFIGMIGFYLLSKKVLNNTLVAFSAYLLLMFSSLGTRLFDSFIIYTCVPMIWFFFFLFSFIERQEKHFFLGLIFCAMLLFSTYIPFYFITIFLFFVICFCLLFFKKIKIILINFLEFFRKNKIFTAFCVFAVIMSLLPGLLFFVELQTEKGQQVLLPQRHSTSDLDNVIGVGLETKTEWGIEEDIMYSSAYSDGRRFKFAVIYLPIFAYLLLLLGVFTNVNKKLFFIFIYGFGLLLMFAHHAPIFNFLHKHIFYFKYFRNLHFFLWIIILPVFILFISEQFRIFLTYTPKTTWNKILLHLFIIIVHLGYGLFIFMKGDVIFSSYLVIFLSLIFLNLYFIFREKLLLNSNYDNFPDYLKVIFLTLILLLIVIQPLEIYNYLNKNSARKDAYTNYRYKNDSVFTSIKLPNDNINNIKISNNIGKGSYALKEKRPFNSYLCLKWAKFLFRNMNPDVYGYYNKKMFIAYDKVEFIDDSDDSLIDFDRIGEAFAKNLNVAFVSEAHAYKIKNKLPEIKSKKANIITKSSKEIKILNFDVNSLKIISNFDSPKFLVYNDNYHPKWKAYVNGKETGVCRANIAYKGMWVPAGRNIVLFKYGAFWQYMFNYFILIFFYSTFIYLLLLLRRYYFNPFNKR